MRNFDARSKRADFRLEAPFSDYNRLKNYHTELLMDIFSLENCVLSPERHNTADRPQEHHLVWATSYDVSQCLEFNLMHRTFYQEPKLEYVPYAFVYYLLFDRNDYKMYQVFSQWFGCTLRQYPDQAAHWIFVVVDLISKAKQLNPAVPPTEENVARWFELLITAARTSWDVPQVKAAISSLLASSATIPEQIRTEVQELLADDYPFDFVRSFAMGPVLTGPYLEMLMEEEDEDPSAVARNAQSDFLVDACWAHFYATGEDLPIKVLLKLAAQRVELAEPDKERKEKHVTRIQQHAINSLRSQPLEHLGLLQMYENILKLDKSMTKHKSKMMLLDQIITDVKDRVLKSDPEAVQRAAASAAANVSPHFQAFLKEAALLSSTPH